jgi:arsenite oxidase small subunit
VERREFIRVCASGLAAAGVPASLAAQNLSAHFYARTRLLGENNKPLLASSLPAQKNLIFHYPFASTPCFLINLGKPARTRTVLKTANNQSYEWSGGVGRTGSIVAYSAICAHQLAYPTRQISFISYRAQANAQNKHAEVIHCCAEHSQYDPAAGGRVVAGPAPQPLAAILLEHDPKTDELAAIGTLGGEMFNQFFAKYEFKLSLEHGGSPRQAVSGTTVVTELDNYCKQQVRC